MVVRPRPGDLEAATRQHLFVRSGEHHGRTGVEICDLCGLSWSNERIHPNRIPPPPLDVTAGLVHPCQTCGESRGVVSVKRVYIYLACGHRVSMRYEEES